MFTLASWRAALLLGLLFFCWGGQGTLRAQAAAPTEQLVLVGSTTMAPLMAEIARRFEHLNPGVRISVAMGGSGRGIKDTRSGVAHIGMVSRALFDDEHDLYGVPIARDGVAVIVHRSNPLAGLRQQQLRELYRGAAATWRDVGGPALPVHALAGTRDAGSSELFTHFIGLSYEQLTTQRRLAANAERIAAVADDPSAIVFVSVGEAERKAAGGVPVKLLAIDGVPATSATVRNGNYPMSRPLMLVHRGAPAGYSRKFIEYCLSSQVTDLILAFDFVPYLD